MEMKKFEEFYSLCERTVSSNRDVCEPRIQTLRMC